jgi:polysaccharide biosynthesis/export protein
MKFPEMQQTLRRSSNVFRPIFLFFILLSLHSCVPSKKYVYFNNLKEDSLERNVIVEENGARFTDPVIQSNDIISVSIQTLVQNENNSPVEPSSIPSTNPLGGYLVDKNGFIELGLLGFVKVAGLTTSEARELIKQKAEVFYKEPAVRVRIANFEVKVLGEVLRPGVVTVPSEKATILDVLALAGDLSATAKRDNILLARTEGDKTTFVRLDLTKTDIFKSPYFYVRQRDYIYVEPSNYKRQNSDNSFMRYLSYGSGVIGIISLLFLTKVIK